MSERKTSTGSKRGHGSAGEQRHHSGSGGHSGHHHHHHHHHSNPKTRWWRNRKTLAATIALVAIVALAAGYWMYKTKQEQDNQQVFAGNQIDVGSGYRDITYEGRRYRYNNRITTILYAGVDSDEPLVKLGRYVAAPRADSISLVVLDELHKSMTIIALSRDTMTDIGKYFLDGAYRGLFEDHLGYAYTYGDGDKVSCRNLCEAVSRLMFGIPINGYVISNHASLSTMGDAIGPVDVTLPNDDLAEYGYPEGSVMTVDSSNLEMFVRTRDTEKDGSNVGRMTRQQAYIESAVGKIVEMLENNASSAWNIIESAEDSVQTDITRSRYLDLVKVLKHTAYSKGNYYIPEGEQVVGTKYDEFYPDKELLHQKVIELFYIER